MFGQLTGRLDGLTDEEYLWDPVAGTWSVRPDLGGTPVAEGAGIGGIDPAPVTTIARRMWHLAVDCFDEIAVLPDLYGAGVSFGDHPR